MKNFKLLNEKDVDRLNKTLNEVSIKEDDSSSETFEMTITKEEMDRDGDVIEVESIDTSNYMKNPVVGLNHSFDVKDIVWKTTNIKKEGDEIIAEFSFANTDLAKEIKKLYKDGFLNASSIGFWNYERDEDDPKMIKNAELLEWSLVYVPSNRNSLRNDKDDTPTLIETLTRQGVLEKDVDKSDEAKSDDDNKEKKITLKEVKELIVGLESKLDKKFETLEKSIQEKDDDDGKSEEKEVEKEIEDEKNKLLDKKALVREINKNLDDSLRKMKQL